MGAHWQGVHEAFIAKRGFILSRGHERIHERIWPYVYPAQAAAKAACPFSRLVTRMAGNVPLTRARDNLPSIPPSFRPSVPLSLCPSVPPSLCSSAIASATDW